MAKRPEQHLACACGGVVRHGLGAVLGLAWSFQLATLDWVHWFNNERPHESIDDLTPVRAEQVHHAARNRLVPTG
ncbi:MAG: integrase core domain-containing protein [Nocardioides sp.]